MAHVADALPEGHHGRAVAAPPGAAHRVHEGQSDRRDRRRLELDRLRGAPRAGPDAGGAADGGAGQALLAATDRSADRREPGAARTDRAGAGPRQRQHGAVQGVPGRHPGDDRRQLGRRPALHAGALPVPRRGGRVSAVGRRRGRSGGPGGSANADVLVAAQGVPGVDADDQGAVGDRARVRDLGQALLLRPLSALRTPSVAPLRTAALGQGPARYGRLPLRGLRAADRRAPEDADAGTEDGRSCASATRRSIAGSTPAPLPGSPASTAGASSRSPSTRRRGCWNRVTGARRRRGPIR